MRRTPNLPFPCPSASVLLGRRVLVPALLAVATPAIGIAGTGTSSLEGRPYGQAWSTEIGAAPTLELDGSSLLLAGGGPGDLAIVFCGESRAHRSLPAGGELLVARNLRRTVGRLDESGAFQIDLDGWLAPDRAAIYVQGVVRVPRSQGEYSLTRGLRVERSALDGSVVTVPVEEIPAFDPWKAYFPPLAVDSVLEALGQPDLGEALVRMLNSAGDELELEIEGEVTAGTGACLGGNVKLAVKVECAEAGVYDLLLGRDASFVGGVELVEGIEAKGTLGVGMDDLWRFRSQDELEHGLAAFAVMQAMGPGAEITAEGAYQAVTVARTAIEAARELVNLRAAALALAERAQRESERAWAHAPYWMRTARHAVLASLRTWAAELRNLVEAAERVRAIAEDAAAKASAACDAAFTALTWVHDSRVFLSEHVHGLELRFAKGAELELSCGPIPGVDLENLGAGIELELERTVHLRWTGPFSADGETLAVSFTSERSTDLDLGFGVGMELDGKRELEIQKTFRRSGDRFEPQASTVRFGVDLAVSGEAGVALTAEAGAGRTLEIVFDADELERVGKDGLAALLAGDSSAAVRALDGTSARFAIDDRLFAGLAFDLGVSYAGNGFTLEAKLRWSDHGTAVEEELPIVDGLARVLGSKSWKASQNVTRSAADEAIQATGAASSAP